MDLSLKISWPFRKFPRNCTSRSSSYRVLTSPASWSCSTWCRSCGALRWSSASNTPRTCRSFGRTTRTIQWASCTSCTSSFNSRITCTCSRNCISRRSRRMNNQPRFSTRLLARPSSVSSTSSRTVASQLCCWLCTTSANSLLTHSDS